MDGTLRILLVDDSEDDALLALQALRRDGLTVQHQRVDSAAGMRAALAAQPWDAVISDYQMPGFNGLDALRMARAASPNIPFILISGKVGEETAVKAMKLGAGDYILKANLTRLGPALKREIAEAANWAEIARVQDRLRESELTWRTMFEGSPVAQILQLQNSTITHVNQRYLDLMGYSRVELVGHTPAEIGLRIPDELSRRFQAALDDCGEVEQMELRLRRKDGFLRRVLVSSCRMQLDGAAHLLHSITDITERLRAEEAARLSQQALASISQGVLISDAQQLTLSVNRAFEVLTGYSQDELVGRKCLVLQGAQTDPQVVRQIRDALGQRQPFTGELLNYRKDGSPFWVELSINPVFDPAGDMTHFVGVQRDITERKAQLAQIRLAAQFFSQSLEGRMVVDPSGSILMVNQAFTSITGYDQDEIRGKNSRILSSGRHDAHFFRQMWDSIDAAGRWQGKLWNRRKDNTEYLEWLTISALRDDAGRVSHYVGTCTDISAQHQAEERVVWLSNFDPLTSLPNRSSLADLCDSELGAAQRGDKPLALMVLGIDGFKVINDSLGHGAGDQLLQQFSHRIKATLRDCDTVARVGGDEFAIVLPGSHPATTSQLAERIRRRLVDVFLIDGQEINLTVSMGAATYPTDGSSFAELAKAAEVAMHSAKKLGTGHFKVFSTEMLGNSVARMTMVTALRSAVAQGQLTLHYQPLVDMQTGRISGMEALLRWNHPQLGAVPPSEFIPLAEQSGLIVEIGLWVFRQACTDITNWRTCSITVPPVSVNISPVQFRDPALLQQVEGSLREFTIDPAMICIEITEGALMEDVVHSQDLIGALKALGVSLSLDDFGTGYSSLSYLKRFPFDKVKIDQSFTRGLATNPQDAVIAKVVIMMAHGLGLRVIAEGTETEAQCEFMRANACDEIQGFFFSRPVPADQMRDLLLSGRCLPAHLLRAKPRGRTLLLVDDEPNVLAALKRLLRREGYHILTASSGPEGLALLEQHPVDIIVSDQRMPGMTGVDFLRQAKARFPDTVRIVLSGYTELQAVTDAVNEGAVYRFLTKPWDDAQLPLILNDAFKHKELADENAQLNLEIRSANRELASTNRRLQELLDTKALEGRPDDQGLDRVCGVLKGFPVPVIALDPHGVVSFVNTRAQALFAGVLVGRQLGDTLKDVQDLVAGTAQGEFAEIDIDGRRHRVHWQYLGEQGRILAFNLQTAVGCA